ncbi:MAG: hypothetical protein M3N32_09165 [Actinomycetota bacterium]|nr:hypothetical protein [Actinomycetota bacterium]
MLQFLPRAASIIADRLYRLVGSLQLPGWQGGHAAGVKGARSFLRLTRDAGCEHEDRRGDDDDDDDHDEKERETDIPLRHVRLTEFVLRQLYWRE